VKKTPTRNITLSLPSALLRRAKILAVERETSLSALLKETLEDLVDREEGYERAGRRSVGRLAQAPDLGTRGRARWTRDGLHER